MPSATLELADKAPDLTQYEDDDILATYVKMRDARLATSKLVALSEEREKTLMAEILRRFPASSTKGQYVIGVSKVEEPMADDWPAIIKYIKDTGSVDLLEKRLLKSGVKARWADGEVVPGVSKIEKTTVKVEVI